jgi:hypothetical protein
MAPRARPDRMRTLADREKEGLTRENTGAPGGDWLHDIVSRCLGT